MTIRSFPSVARRLAAALAAALLAAPAAHAQPADQAYDFESVRGAGCAGGPPFTEYAGLTWTNAYVASSSLGSGWVPGATSGVCTAYNGFGSQLSFASANPFTFRSAQLTAGFRNDFQLRVQGFRVGQTAAAFEQVVDLSMTAARAVTFDFADVHEVRFAAANAGDGHFVMDGLVIVRGAAAPTSTVPEPGTWALLGTGLAGLAGGARRRRQA